MKALFLFLALCMLTTLAKSETYDYELKGSYKLQSSKKMPINYSLKWNEKDGSIKGIYSDNHFTKEAVVTGEGGTLGRTFNVKFPVSLQGVRTITLLGPMVKEKQTSLPQDVSIITRNERGTPLTTVKSKAQFNAKSGDVLVLAQMQEDDDECVKGFGVLANYCGIYNGIISESQDRRNRCNLLFADAVRLELKKDSTVILHLGEVNEFINSPGHSIGKIPTDPQKNNIDVMSRVCGPLSGVNSSSGSCKIIHLTGTFSINRDFRHFEGKYEITEENTNNSCTYTLSMDRQE